MKLLQASSAALVGMALCSALYAYQRTADFGFGDDAETNVKAEFYWSRLSYNAAVGSSFTGGYGGYGGFGGYGWRHPWSRDYPKADRQVLLAMKRLTRIQGRSTEQVVNLDSDEIFNYPWIYAVQVQTWSLTDEEAKRLREYLLKGGFLMVDDFHGTTDWEDFMNGMREVFPDRPVEDLDGKDEIFHVLYDLMSACKSPGSNIYRPGGRTKRMATCPSGGPFVMTRAVSWSPSVTTCTWATRGNGRTIRITPNRSHPWRSGWH
jgi:hypothetical protein